MGIEMFLLHQDYTFYERYTNQRSCDGVLNATNIIANGSWLTDHFSANGANLVIDFWEDNLLDHDTRRLLKYVGEHCELSTAFKKHSLLLTQNPESTRR